MIFEITNPSDPYTMQSDSKAAAFVAVALLGQGYYGLSPLDSGQFSVPIALFGDWDKGIYDAAEIHPTSMEGVRRWLEVYENREPLATVLDSVRIGGIADRDRSKDEHDSRRSSMNDIGRRAWRMAAQIRAKLKTSEATP